MYWSHKSLRANLFLLFCGWFFSSQVIAEDVIHINTGSGPKAEYVVSIIRLALEKAQKKYRIERDTTTITQSRIAAEVESGNLDIMWTSANVERESQFLPIRICLLKGLVGYRILMIRQGEQARFDNVHTLEDLKKFTFGHGKTWADTPILTANGLKVITTTKSPGLFYMLDRGRFDAFPRGASEPFEELKKYPNLPLTVEKNLVLAYPLPFYLFVNKNNKKLADDLYAGLNIAIADGSFDKAFEANPTVQDVRKLANLGKRRVIYLENPTLPKETPVDRKELWIDIKDF